MALKKCYISPTSKEIASTIIKAACNLFEIDKETLLFSSELSVCEIRHCCYYLIMKNTDLKDYAVGEIMGGKHRGTINHGMSKIEVQKNIYPQTFRNLNSIIKEANNFEKQHPWQLLPID